MFASSHALNFSRIFSTCHPERRFLARRIPAMFQSRTPLSGFLWRISLVSLLFLNLRVDFFCCNNQKIELWYQILAFCAIAWHDRFGRLPCGL
jgi:hypothetical protein